MNTYESLKSIFTVMMCSKIGSPSHQRATKEWENAVASITADSFPVIHPELIKWHEDFRTICKYSQGLEQLMLFESWFRNNK